MKNTYEVTLFFHTNLTVSVKADSEESAIKIAESAGIDKGRLLEMAMNAVKDGSSEVRLVKTGEQEKKEKMESYTRAPWHEAKKELPSFGGARCVCYMPMYGCEVEMVFHRSRPDSGYKDFFVESAKGGRAYDWNYIQYWRYFNEKQEGTYVLNPLVFKLKFVYLYESKLPCGNLRRRLRDHRL